MIELVANNRVEVFSSSVYVYDDGGNLVSNPNCPKIALYCYAEDYPTGIDRHLC